MLRQARPLTFENFLERETVDISVVPTHRILYEDTEISAQSLRTAEVIAEDYGEKNQHTTAVYILNGGCYPFFHLVGPHLYPLLPELTATGMQLASYGKAQYSTGQVTVLLHPDRRLIKDRYVLVFEDLLDTGLSAEVAAKLLFKAGAISVDFCILLRKTTTVISQYLHDSGCKFYDVLPPIPSEIFLFGCGMDYENQHRLYPHLAGIEKEAKPVTLQTAI